MGFSALSFQEEIKLSAIYDDVLKGEQNFLFENVLVIDDVDPLINEEDPDSVQFINALSAVLGRPITSNQLLNSIDLNFEVKESKGAMIFNCLNIESFLLADSEFEYIQFSYSQIGEVELLDNVLDELIIEYSEVNTYKGEDLAVARYEILSAQFRELYDEFQADITEYVIVENSHFHDGFSLDVAEASSNAHVSFEENVFESRKSREFLYHDEDSALFRTQFRFNTVGELSELFLNENDFLNDGLHELVVVVGNFNILSISNNEIGPELILEGSVQNTLSITENVHDKYISITDLNIRDTGGLNLSLGELMDSKLAISQFQEDYYEKARSSDLFNDLLSQVGGDYLVLKNENDQSLDREDFNYLISDYYRLHVFYKENGFHENADLVYLRMKDVELNKLRSEWKIYGGLERLIKWQLNSILKYYTRFGTSPARAIVISFILLLVFTVFYFFFPSEWDTRSKAQILIDFRAFKEKNDQGYLKPFISLMYDLFKSFANAFSLSLNSFITLGFGAIPTTGVARYVCILQGFLGWFLLSIFTASLISQILY